MDFSPDYTPRIVYRYIAAGVTHNILFRGRIGESLLFTQSRAEGAFVALVTALAAFLPDDFAVSGGTYYTTGSSVGIPIAGPAALGSGSAPAEEFSKQDKITHLTFQGRSTGGSKVSIKLYCAQLNPDVLPDADESDFRINPGESPAFTAAVAALNSAGLNAVDGLTVFWHGFVNVKVNDYWLRQLRKGAI